jgi:hypothetical protein
LKVRLSDDELRRLDAAVGLRGGTRAGLTRRLRPPPADGLSRELTLEEALAPFAAPGADWRAAAAALEKQFLRWADPAA